MGVLHLHIPLFTLHEFTFWISLLLRLLLSPKYGLRPKISKKWSHFFHLDSVIA